MFIGHIIELTYCFFAIFLINYAFLWGYKLFMIFNLFYFHSLEKSLYITSIAKIKVLYVCNIYLFFYAFSAPSLSRTTLLITLFNYHSRLQKTFLPRIKSSASNLYGLLFAQESTWWHQSLSVLSTHYAEKTNRYKERITSEN